MILSDSFYEYCAECYLPDGVFAYENLTPEFLKAVCDIVEKRKDIPFNGDSTDRETVAAIIFSLGYREK